MPISIEAQCHRINTNKWPWDKIECMFRIDDIKYGNNTMKLQMGKHLLTVGYTQNSIYLLDKYSLLVSYFLDHDEYFTELIYKFHFLRRGANQIAIIKFLPAIGKFINIILNISITIFYSFSYHKFINSWFISDRKRKIDFMLYEYCYSSYVFTG